MDFVLLMKIAVYVGVPAFGIWWVAMERRTMRKLKEKAGLDSDDDPE